jgi:hypothetical protein
MMKWIVKKLLKMELKDGLKDVKEFLTIKIPLKKIYLILVEASIL